MFSFFSAHSHSGFGVKKSGRVGSMPTSLPGILFPCLQLLFCFDVVSLTGGPLDSESLHIFQNNSRDLIVAAAPASGVSSLVRPDLGGDVLVGASAGPAAGIAEEDWNGSSEAGLLAGQEGEQENPKDPVDDSGQQEAASEQVLAEGAKLFRVNCVQCHALDKVVIGPILKGVTERRGSTVALRVDPQFSKAHTGGRRIRGRPF